MRWVANHHGDDLIQSNGLKWGLTRTGSVLPGKLECYSMGSYLPERVDPFSKVHVIHRMQKELLRVLQVGSGVPDGGCNFVQTAAHNHGCAVTDLLVGFRIHAW